MLHVQALLWQKGKMAVVVQPGACFYFQDVKGPVRCFDLEEEEELVGMPSAPKDDQPHFAQKSTSPEQRYSNSLCVTVSWS